MKYIINILLIVLFSSGCGTSPPKDNRIEAERSFRRAYRNIFTQVTIEDGISQKEATQLSDIYLTFCAGVGCGGHDMPIDSSDVWLVPVAVGVAAKPAGNIIIDKKTACISWVHGPRITYKELANKLKD
ncbi:MAG: hypothetical protein GY845_18800 [Planctomycetes bacterium]|nr:hypothetical protein [Planctomycetota bacterium]